MTGAGPNTQMAALSACAEARAAYPGGLAPAWACRSLWTLPESWSPPRLATYSKQEMKMYIKKVDSGHRAHQALQAALPDSLRGALPCRTWQALHGKGRGGHCLYHSILCCSSAFTPLKKCAFSNTCSLLLGLQRVPCTLQGWGLAPSPSAGATSASDYRTDKYFQCRTNMTWYLLGKIFTLKWKFGMQN